MEQAHRLLRFVLIALIVFALFEASSSAALGQGYGHYLPPNHINPHSLSQAAQGWWFGPALPPAVPSLRPPFSSSAITTNVDADNPNLDVAPGQSETAIAAAGNLVMEAWNDASTFFIQPSTDPQASGTGVAFSSDGAQSFTDLLGLPNSNPNQKWAGNPSVVAVENGKYFIIGSIYADVYPYDCNNGPAQFAIALSVATINSNSVHFTSPIIAATGGDACSPGGQTALLDEPFMSYDPLTRTLAVTYNRHFFYPGSGKGQIEVVTAIVPPSPAHLSSVNFTAPVVIWPEESVYENAGVFPALAYNSSTGRDDIYTVWERNWITNQTDGNPYVYIQAAVVSLGEFGPSNLGPVIGGPSSPIVVTKGQANSLNGGVKSLDLVPVTGFNATANDFPRVAWDSKRNQVVIVWGDASNHPLGDIYMRAYTTRFAKAGPIERVNDDDSGAVHMQPAVCVQTDGSIVTSWYDRRNYPPGSASTDYYGEVRSNPTTNGVDFQINTVSSDWLLDSSAMIPNFGDYTDSACTGKKVFFTWSDGRLGFPQPFVAAK